MSGSPEPETPIVVTIACEFELVAGETPCVLGEEYWIWTWGGFGGSGGGGGGGGRTNMPIEYQPESEVK